MIVLVLTHFRIANVSVGEILKSEFINLFITFQNKTKKPYAAQALQTQYKEDARQGIFLPFKTIFCINYLCIVSFQPQAKVDIQDLLVHQFYRPRKNGKKMAKIKMAK